VTLLLAAAREEDGAESISLSLSLSLSLFLSLLFSSLFFLRNGKESVLRGTLK
jgi:hypothetical protein